MYQGTIKHRSLLMEEYSCKIGKMTTTYIILNRQPLLSFSKEFITPKKQQKKHHGAKTKLFPMMGEIEKCCVILTHAQIDKNLSLILTPNAL
jgi:hypothetical protein